MPDVLPLSSSPVFPAERASRTPPLSAVLTAHAAPPASPLQTAGGEVVGQGGSSDTCWAFWQTAWHYRQPAHTARTLSTVSISPPLHQALNTLFQLRSDKMEEKKRTN